MYRWGFLEISSHKVVVDILSFGISGGAQTSQHFPSEELRQVVQRPRFFIVVSWGWKLWKMKEMRVGIEQRTLGKEWF